MIFYILFPLICFLFHFDHRLRRYFLFELVFILLLVLFLCGGYMTGTDWRMYEDIYNKILWSDLRLYPSETGFYILILISKSLNIDFWIFLITLKVTFFIVYLQVSRLFNISRWLFLGLAFPFYMYLFIDNPLRNFIAITLFMLSIKYLINNSAIKYYLVILLAINFHISALILLLIYPIRNLKISSNALIIIYITFFIIFSSRTILIYLLYKAILIFPFLLSRMEDYLAGVLPFEASGSILTLRSFIILGVFFLMIYYRKKIENDFPYGKSIFLLTIMYLFSFRLGLTFQVLSRLTYYFFFFYLYIIILIGNSIKTKLIRSVFWIGFIVITLYSTYSLSTSDYRYLPYSNYLIRSIRGDMPSYDVRFYYNMKNSPYKDNNNNIQ